MIEEGEGEEAEEEAGEEEEEEEGLTTTGEGGGTDTNSKQANYCSNICASVVIRLEQPIYPCSSSLGRKHIQSPSDPNKTCEKGAVAVGY